MEQIKSYGNFIKVEHTLFSLPLILSGTFLAANGLPQPKLLILIILAGVGARTAAIGINRIIDREIDSKNPRTVSRELPSGKIPLSGAFAVIGAGILSYFVSAYFICSLVFYLSPLPLIVFLVYPYMKRFTYLCHFGVGAALALAPLGGWLAVTCSFKDILPAVLLCLFTFFWVSGFDIIYATLDEESDSKSGIYSFVSIFGKNKALLSSAALHIMAFLCLVFLYIEEFNSLYAVPFLVLSGLLLYLEFKKSSNVDLAFFKINVIVGFVVFLFVISGIYLP